MVVSHVGPSAQHLLQNAAGSPHIPPSQQLIPFFSDSKQSKVKGADR